MSNDNLILWIKITAEKLRFYKWDNLIECVLSSKWVGRAVWDLFEDQEPCTWYKFDKAMIRAIHK